MGGLSSKLRRQSGDKEVLQRPNRDHSRVFRCLLSQLPEACFQGVEGICDGISGRLFAVIQG